MPPAFPESSLDARLSDTTWRPSLGAWPEKNGVRFRVWAPEHPRVDVVWEEARGSRWAALVRLDDGSFTGVIEEIGPGTRYRYRLSGDRLQEGDAEKILQTWLTTPFEGGRHARRVEKIADVEKSECRK